MNRSQLMITGQRWISTIMVKQFMFCYRTVSAWMGILFQSLKMTQLPQWIGDSRRTWLTLQLEGLSSPTNSRLTSCLLPFSLPCPPMDWDSLLQCPPWLLGPIIYYNSRATRQHLSLPHWFIYKMYIKQTLDIDTWSMLTKD